MANKRMFTMKIVDSDAFLEMPLSTQCLYFHLNMRADDDGFIGNPKKIMRIIGALEDDLKLLIAKRFVLSFEDGVIVIKHWRMHNTLSQNRYHETQYVDEKSMLKLKDNGSYSFENGKRIDDKKLIESSNRQLKDGQKTDKRRDIDGQKTDSDLDLDKDIELDKELDLDKDLNNNPLTPLQSGEDEVKEPKRKRFVPPTIDEVKAYCIERDNGIDAQVFVDFYISKGWMIGKNKMSDWKAAVRTWENKQKNKGSAIVSRQDKMNQLLEDIRKGGQDGHY